MASLYSVNGRGKFGYRAFLAFHAPCFMLHWPYMSNGGIICRATPDTFVRLGIVIAAFLGFAVYFFYDGAVGYRLQNEAICSFKAFAELGAQVSSCPEPRWREQRAAAPLIAARQEGGMLFAEDSKGHRYPLPEDCEATRSCPPEARDYVAMAKGWNDCWAAYSKRMHFPIKPGEHPHDEGAIREQWIAGGIFTGAGLLLLALAFRTYRRELSLQGDTITAAGRQFSLADIQLIDLRQWGPGFKGVAYFTVNGKRVRIDGMTYGGFNKAKGEPAEQFMKAVLARYQGDIIDYEASAQDKPHA